MGKVPERVRSALNRFSDRVMESEKFNLRAWVMDVVEAIYADPPAWQTPGFQPLDLGTNIISEPLVAGAWYELEGLSMHAGGVFQCKENDRIYSQRPGKFIIGNSMFNEDGTCMDGIPGFTHQPILRRVWLTEKEPEAARQLDPWACPDHRDTNSDMKCDWCRQVRAAYMERPVAAPDPIEAVLRALDTHEGVYHPSGKHWRLLHPQQIEGIRLLLKDVKRCHEHPLGGTPATIEAVNLFTAATRETK